MAWLDNENVPILSMEGANHDEFHLGTTGNSANTNDDLVDITLNGSIHPITSGFDSPLNVTVRQTNTGHVIG